MHQGVLTTEFTAMSTLVRLLFSDSEPGAPIASELVRQVFSQNEQRFSRFLPDSELSQLNRSNGERFRASLELFRLVSAALMFREQTWGLFDPTLLHEIESAGYDKSFDTIPQERHSRTAPSSGSPVTPRAVAEVLKLDAETRTILLAKGIGIDLGGIAKGWTVDEVCSRLTLDSSFLIDGGGDIYARGAGTEGSGWAIGVADPFNDAADVALLRLSDSAIATSAITRRRWTIDGEERHHLIDPRTGSPVENDIASVSVVGTSVTIAEVWAKALLIAGLDGAASLLAHRADCSALVITKDGRQVWLNGMDRYRIDA